MKINCQVCSKEFRGSYHLQRHQLSMHQVRSDKPSDMDLISHGIGDRYRCEVCGREFNHIRSKERHKGLHSPDNPYKCTQEGCDKDHFVRHLQNIHNIEPAKGSQKPKKPRAPPEKEVQCPHCDKVIKRDRLRLHMVIHTGEKRHKCDQCGQTFGLRTTLLSHIQCVHQGVRRYICSYCGQSFKRSNHLKDHEKLIHTDADSKTFVCNICDKGFGREKNLKSHMICHIQSKDYMCEICGKAFNRIDNMRAHIKTVHQGLNIRKKKATAASAASAASTAVTSERADGNSIIMNTMPTAVLVAVDPMNPGVHQELEIRTEGDEEISSFVLHVIELNS